MPRPVYIADTSMWITLVKFYPASVFPSLVQQSEAMIKDRRILSPLQVLDEIRRGNDEVVTWADEHKSAFRPNTSATVAHATKIARKYPFLGGSGGGHDRADPYLIALALSIKEDIDGMSLPVIVTEENQTSGKKIPQVAQAYDVESCGTVGMFEMEGWAF